MTHIPNNTLPSSSNELDAKRKEKLRGQLKDWVKKNQLMLEILLDAYCVVDTESQVVDFNVAFTELCGESYRKVKKIADFSSLLHTEQSPIKDVLEAQKSLRLDEIRGSSKAFPDLKMIIGAIPVISDSGDSIGALITMRNVTAESLLQKKYDERKKESVIDGLTKVYNKVYAEENLLKMLKATLRDSKPLSVVMTDIDHFKKVNDTFGHPTGDHVLAAVSGLLKDESRDTDAVGRFGGEEFIVILAKSDVEGAKIFAERYRKRVESTKISFEGNEVPVRVSIGTATFNQEWAPGMDLGSIAKELVSKADTALYFAKANGRNQVCQIESLPSENNNRDSNKK